MKNKVTRNRKLWLFNSGANFIGNPKWLFLYMNKYRNDIECIWLAENAVIHNKMKKLGYNSVLIDSNKGKKIQEEAGVYVVNQVKEYIPETMFGVVILNLWHGVGGKTIERKLNFSYIRERVAKKYIKYNDIYVNNQLFLVTSNFMEQHFKEHCGLEDHQLVRAGYPCNEIPLKYPNLKSKEPYITQLFKSVENVIVYAPTYRYENPNDFFKKAIPDMENLKDALEKNNSLLVFKMHPMMEKDIQYQWAKQHYKNEDRFLFWDNSLDIYEYFDDVDIAIVDYSSIYYDMVSSGIKKFIRYVFDFENKRNIEGLVFDYLDKTTGPVCENFSELIACIENYPKEKNQTKLQEVHNEFWGYSDIYDVEIIINQVLNTEMQKKEMAKLYSFDVFDTLIQRKTLDPMGIFFYVKEMAENSKVEFPPGFLENYIEIRRTSEQNVREYYQKTRTIRKSSVIEITFDEIFERMKSVYSLNENQITFLKAKEIEAEFKNCEKKNDIANYAEELVEQGNDVILISDMYLPKEVIKEMLKKVSPLLSKLPLYVSSEYRNRKINRTLFLDVYDDLNYTKYESWNHFGDNRIGDGKAPEALGINATVHKISKFNKYEKHIINRLRSYDSYQIATLLSRYREDPFTTKSYFSYAMASLYFIPYIHWTLKDAINKNIDTLYFLSRDGHHLKNIAEVIIKEKKLNIKVQYIYGSRKAWRIPSFIDNIDEEFFGEFGNFTGVNNYLDLKKALWLDEEEFDKYFFDYKYIKNIKSFSQSDREQIITAVKNSHNYKSYLLEKAKKSRREIQLYLQQEIDFNEKFAFVEYWGRGYTQSCLNRIINDIDGIDVNTVFYYVRSIYPSVGKDVRENFTTSMYSLNFIEAIFANLPYKSIESYLNTDGYMKPKIEENSEYDEELFLLMEKNLIKFTEDYCACEFIDESKLTRELFDSALAFYHTNPSDVAFEKCLSHLQYNEGMYGEDSKFARSFRYTDIIPLIRGQRSKLKTHSIQLSLSKSPMLIQKIYKLRGSNTFKKMYGFYSKTLRKLVR